MCIKFMMEYLCEYGKDMYSCYGFMVMFECWKKFLKYFRRIDGDRYADVILRFGLKD